VQVNRFWVLAVLVLCIGKTQAESAEAQVIHVGDGDSLTVCIGGRESRVRLVGIDAPEYRQRYGRTARRSLASLCEYEVARLEWSQADRYGRLLARVTCRGVEANAEQVRRGMAWASHLDAPDPSLDAAQAAAREARAGLWRDADPQPPWQWRREDRATGGRQPPTPGDEAPAASPPARGRAPVSCSNS
jgi:endonuclease YncB( thermonuclease family)